MRMRRIILPTLVAILLLVGCSAKEATPQKMSLKEVFGDKFLIGVALNTRQVEEKTVRQQNS